jgi:hypothetical protein
MMKIWLPKLNYYSKRLSRWHEKLWEELTGKPYMGIIDNVAGVRFYKEAYGTIGAKQHLFRIKPEPYSPQGPTKHFTSVSAFPYGTTAAAGVVDSGLTTQLDRGRLQWDTTPDTAADPCYAYGYSVTGEHYLSFGSMGTIDDDTYNDGGGTSRTIKALYQTDNCGTTIPQTTTRGILLLMGQAFQTPIRRGRILIGIIPLAHRLQPTEVRTQHIQPA